MLDTAAVWTQVWYSNRRFDETSIRVNSNEHGIWIEVHQSKYKVFLVVAIVASVMVPMLVIAAYVSRGDVWATAAICLVAAGAIARGPDFSSIRFCKATRVIKSTRRFTFEKKTSPIEVRGDTEFEIDGCHTTESSYVALRIRKAYLRNQALAHFGVSRSGAKGLEKVLGEFAHQVEVACSNV